VIFMEKPKETEEHEKLSKLKNKLESIVSSMKSDIKDIEKQQKRVMKY
jgi:hypothetical protein